MASKKTSLDRRLPDPRITVLDGRVATLDERCNRIECQIKKNTELTQSTADIVARVDHNTTDIVEAWKALAGGLKVLCWLWSAAKWCGIVATALTAVGALWYALTHGGQSPPPPIDLPK